MVVVQPNICPKKAKYLDGKAVTNKLCAAVSACPPACLI